MVVIENGSRVMKQYINRAALAGALIVGFTLGAAVSHLPHVVNAEIRGGANRKPVPSGALQSVPLLQQMSKSLESIDARLARMESTLQRIAEQ